MLDALEPTVAQDQPLLSVEQVAKRLNVTELTVRRWLMKGILPGYRFSGEWRIEVSDLEAFLRERRRPKKGN